jgi:hypothetical protein
MRAKERLYSIAILTAVLTYAPTGRAEPFRLEIVSLENNAALGTHELNFIQETISSIFAELPRERFIVESVERGEPDDCDDRCQLELAKERGAYRVVLGEVSSFGNGYAAILKIYDAVTGQLIKSADTNATGTLQELIGEIKQAAFVLRAQLARPAKPEPKVNPPTAMTQSIEPQPPAETNDSLLGKLLVETKPVGAEIYVSRKKREIGHYEGKSPIEKALLPLTYWITAKLPEHQTAKFEVQIDPSESEHRVIKLDRIYPMNPYKIYGHLAFWSGIAFSGLGVLSLSQAQNAANDYHESLDSDAKEDSQIWTGMMWTSFGISGALMATGIVLWILSPGDKKYYEMNHSAAVGLRKVHAVTF